MNNRIKLRRKIIVKEEITSQFIKNDNVINKKIYIIKKTDVNKKTVYLLNRGYTVFCDFLYIRLFTILIKVYMSIKLK